MEQAAAKRSWTWWLAGGLIAVPAACCAGLALLGRAVGRPEVTVTPGVEAPGTLALEGTLAGLRGDPMLSVCVGWRDDRDGAEGARALRVRARDGGFRVVLPAPSAGRRDLSVSVFSDDRMGGTAHMSLGGNVPIVAGGDRDRVSGVPVDMRRGMDFAGTVRDARTGAPLAGVRVVARTVTYGRDGWGPPTPAAVSDDAGRWALYGVQSARLTDRARPALGFSLPRYATREEAAPAPASGQIRVVDVALSPL